MKRTLMLAAAAAGLLSAVAPAAMAQSAAGMGLEPLRAGVVGALRSRGLPTDGVAGLSTAQLATVKMLLDSHGTDEQETLRLRKLLAAR